MKKILSILVISALLLTVLAYIIPPAVSAEGGIRVFVEGVEITFDVPPVMKNDRVLVPLRKIFEALYMDVDWDGETETITSTGNGNTIVLQIGNPVARANARTVTLDVSAEVVDGRTLVPIRFIAESIGAQVGWDGDTQTVTVKTNTVW